MSRKLTAAEERDVTLAGWRAIGFVIADMLLHPDGAAELMARITRQLEENA